MTRTESTRGKLASRSLHTLNWAIFALLLLALFLGIIWGYSADWTGFGSSTSKDGHVPAKTLWDWLDLILVPAFLALGAWLLQNSRKRSETLVEIDRQRQATLNQYLTSMTKLLLEEKLEGNSAQTGRAVARTSTLAALRGLDGARKAQLLQFLYESGLIGTNSVVQLNGADFRSADLESAFLRDAEMRGVHLRNAVLRNAVLCGANFCGSDLSRADLTGADLASADFSQANLSGALVSPEQLASATVDDAMLPATTRQ